MLSTYKLGWTGYTSLRQELKKSEKQAESISCLSLEDSLLESIFLN